jgi:hypothetical protein
VSISSLTLMACPFEKNSPETIKECPVVLEVPENRSLLDSSENDMVKGTGCVYAGLARHPTSLHGSLLTVNT